jgi:hypothetical protein
MRRVLAGAFAIAALAQDLAQAPTGSVTGKAVDPGMMFVPLPSVGIIAGSNSFSGTTADGDNTGAFRLSGIPVGDYIFAAKVRGFREIVQFVKVEAGKETNLGTVLLPLGSCDDPGVTCSGPKNGSAAIPVIGVCDALTKRDLYFSRQVIVVGRLSETKRETTLSADCPFSLATGSFAWPSSIAVADAAGARLPVLPAGFEWDEKALDQAKRSLPEAGKKERLAAIFGRFESPAGLVTLDCPRRVSCSPGMTMVDIPPALLIQDAVKTSRYLE